MSKISLNTDNLLNPQTNKEPLRLDDLENKIIRADCIDILRELPDKCVDLVLTDPPYGQAEQDFIRAGGRLKKYGYRLDKWDTAPAQEYFAEIFRVSKNQIIWGGNYFDLPPTRCFNVWRKLTISEAFSMAMCEYAWCSFNSNAKYWEYPPQDSERFHPTQKPVKLIERQLNEYTKEGDLVLDCFSGSGTTAIACHRLNRRFICIEKDKEYYEASVKRLEDERKQLSLFGGNE